MEGALADVGLWDLALIALLAFLTSIVGGLSGYGIGVVLPAFIAPVVGVVAVIPVMAVAMSFANASRVWAYWRTIAPSRVAALMAVALPMAAIGSMIYVHLSAETIATMLGVFLIAVVPIRRILEARKFVMSERGLLVVVAGYGFLAGGMSGAGLLMVAGLMAAGVQGGALIATDAAVATSINLLKVGVFGGYELLTPELFLAGALIGLCTVPGAFVARRIIDRLPLRAHVWMMEAVVIAGGLSFLWRAGT
jgi:uncharacterized membrane protein YfcA